jgi:hypothetical protein
MLQYKQNNVELKNISSDIHNIELNEDKKNNSRTSCFYAFADKNTLSASLSRTKPCRLVVKKPDGSFGVCNRDKCSFAHSQEELQIPLCMFDETCRTVYGKYDKNTNDFIPNTYCTFKHSFETKSQWLKRTNTVLPELPLTNEFSRNKTMNNVNNTNVNNVNNTNVNTNYMNNMNNMNNTNMNTNYMNNTNNINHTTNKPISYSDIVRNVPVPIEEQSHNSNNYSNTYSNNSNVSIINVPNQELAEFALKSLFELGVFNIKIVVD